VDTSEDESSDDEDMRKNVSSGNTAAFNDGTEGRKSEWKWEWHGTCVECNLSSLTEVSPYILYT